MQSKNVVLAYKGNVSGDLFNCILQLAENKLDKIELRAKLKKRVFHILVEILQNVYHHFDELGSEDKELYTVIFLLTKEGQEYNIVTGNHVLNERANDLKHRIDRINAMSAEELKSIYRERLNSGDVTEKGRAGLGILDIVRRSGRKLQYQFSSINDRYSFFSLEVKVSA